MPSALQARMNKRMPRTIPNPNPTFRTFNGPFVPAVVLFTVSSIIPRSQPIITPTSSSSLIFSMQISCPCSSFVYRSFDLRNSSVEAAPVSSSPRMTRLEGEDSNAREPRRLCSISGWGLSVGAGGGGRGDDLRGCQHLG